MNKKQSASKSAFFNFRVLLGLVLCLFAVALSLYALGIMATTGNAASATSESAQKGGFDSPTSSFGSKSRVLSVRSYKNDVSLPLREMAAAAPSIQLKVPCELKENPKTGIFHKDAPDGALQSSARIKLNLQQPNLNIPSATLNFDGIAFPGVVCSCAPPDTNGAAGLNQYVQQVNEGIQVFNKSTGASQFGPVSISSLWTGFGGVCEFNGHGDGVLLYDHFANRWLVSQFAGSSVPTDECVAISTSADATGSYYRYGFHLGTNYFDYPKIGVWPDGYYMSMNVFSADGSTFLGPQPFALDRANMLLGNPATFVSPVGPAGGSVGPFLPADIDGPTLPASGAPETFVGFPAAGSYTIYHFHVDFGTPANSTWTTFATPPAAAFTQLCSTGTNNGRACVPQSGVTTSTSGLDGIGDRLMHRAAYRNFGDHESVVTSYAVCATGACGTAGAGGGTSGVRWIELQNVTNGPVTVFQESTYQPDTTWRWLSSAAMDNAGDIAVGFSTSTSTTFPGLRYAGRLASDPINTLAQGEATLFTGTGSQSSTGDRWGDYSNMSVDPQDDCTFWYTNEYYSTTSQFNWRTRIGNFAFAQCVPATPQQVAAVSVNKTADAAAVTPGSNIGFKVTVNSSGNIPATGISFSDSLPSGPGINWTLDGANTDPGWSISGSPPNQSLVFTPTTMAAGTSLKAHLTSSTTSADCGTTFTNTAMVSSSNGGSGTATASTGLDCTNCTPNAWTDNSPQAVAPANIMDQAVGVLGNNIFMFTGVSNGALTNATRKYDTVGNTWTSLANFPTSVESPVAVCDGVRYCFTMGGFNVTTVRRYDTTGNTFTTLTSFTNARAAAGAVYFNNKIYLMGGLNSSTGVYQTSLQIGTLSGSPPTVTWAAGAALPVGVAWPQVTYANVGGTDYIYLAGGTSSGGDQNIVYRYNISGNSWSTVGTMPATIWSASNGVVNSYWVLAGGYVNGNPSSTTYSYNFSTNTWTLNASSMVQPRARGNGGAVGGTSLFSLGGRNDGAFNGTSDDQKYTPSLCPPGFVSVVSRMTHGNGAGTFDLTLSTMSRVVEPRDGSGNFTIVFNFAQPVNSGNATTMGSVGSVTTSFSGNSMIVSLTGVSDQQNVTVTANNVSGPGTSTLASVSTQVGFLIGDATQNAVVNVGDSIQVRNNAGVTLDNTNFINDVNADGMVNAGDTIVVRNNSSHFLP